MIKFFRKIRQQLLKEGKTTNYLKYAIGEIILVVIGILIALQINNWNEKRKSNKEAHEVLLSLQEDFQTNISLIKQNSDRVKNMSYNTSKLIETIDRENINVNPDSLGYYIVVGGGSWWREQTRSNTYDALSGAGKLDLIRNKKLQELLANFYSTTKTGFEDEANIEIFATQIIERTSYESYILWSADRWWGDSLKLTDKTSALRTEAVNSVLGKKELLGSILMKHVLELNQQNYIANLLSLSHSVLNEIEQELKKWHD
ncbi:hypothetical protein KO566_08140 [Flavobacteriaceae bacterium XHP0103]|uniref:DUF6090 family protein n=1 Tax=Marixanthotalea marina TaxID=2844359 RepID=UPI00298A04E5|nr:DUF6090 family protein [Marixanthotalea marina]MBU3822025.1 hypothetical protein [Marixanthotalea marina]